MGTRSDIIVHRQDGKWHRIYCHWDGYLEHNGRILFDHYTSQKAADSLVALGNLSSLGPVLGTKHPFDKPRDDAGRARYDKKYAGMCLSYLRDRPMGSWHWAKTKAEFIASESGTIGDTLQAVWPEAETWTEFTYVWDQDKWWCGLPDEGTQTLLDLGDLLLGKRTLAASVKAFGMVIGQHQKTEPGQDHGWTGAS